MISTNGWMTGRWRIMWQALHLSPPSRSAIVLLVIAIACCSCSENKSPAPPASRAELKPAVDWLGRYYQKIPPGNGWQIASVTSQGAQVQIIVAIPAEQASVIMRQPAIDQFRQVARQVCPPPGGEFWQLLPAGSSVKVLPSVSGQVFIEVDCGQ